MPLVTEDQIATPRTFAAKDAATLILSGKIDPFIPEARKRDAAALYSACIQELNGIAEEKIDIASVGQCLAASAKLYLPPGLPESFCNFVARNEKKWDKVKREETTIKKVSWTLTYRGIVNLAYRSGFLVRLDAEYVLKGETFRHRHTSDRGVRIFHELPANRQEFKMEDLECVYATWQTKDGAVSGFVVPGWKVRAIQGTVLNYSKNSPWKSMPDAMARKTAVKHASSYLPLGEDTAFAAKMDDEGDDFPAPVLIDVPATDQRTSDKSAASSAAMLRMLTSDVEQQGRIRQWILSQSSAEQLSSRPEDLVVCEFLSDRASLDAARQHLLNSSI